MMLNAAILICFALLSESGAEKCRLFDYCHSNSVCRNFTSLAQLSKAAEECLRADERSLFAFFNPQTTEKVFMAVTEQEMNRQFDIHLWKWIFLKNKNKTLAGYGLYFYDIAQVDYTGYSSDYINKTGDYEFIELSIQIARSARFDQSTCDQNTTSWQSFLHSVTHSLRITGGRYLNYLCPFWFKDVELSFLVVSSNHGFKFKEVKEMNEVSSNITSLTLNSMHKLDLDQNLLSVHVFGNLTDFSVTSTSLFKISPSNLFEHFKRLRSVDLSDIINTQGFFHSTNGIEWIMYLNRHIYMKIENHITKRLSETDYFYVLENAMTLKLSPSPYQNNVFPYNWYIYPDEDLCLFGSFPHQQLVVPIIQTFYDINCSCTMAWLLKYNSLVYHRYNFSFLDDIIDIYFQQKSPCSPNDPVAFEQMFESCNISHRLSLCTVQERSSSHDSYFDFYDLKKGLETAHLYLLDYAGPVISVIGLVANFVIVIVFIHNKHDSRQFKTAENTSRDMLLLSERLYQLMFLNAIVNLAYCLMYFLDFTIHCTPTPYYDYTDHVNFNLFELGNCLVKDAVVSFVGSTLKMVSNTLLVFISLNRYVLIGKEHKKFIIKLSSISNKKLLILSSILSCLLSVIVVFQYITWSNQTVLSSGNKNHTVVLYAYDSYPVYFNYILRYSSVLKHLEQLSVLVAFSVIHDCFSYLFFCIIILVLDIATIKKLKEALSQHASMVKTIENELDKQKAETKSIIMVWINSIVNFILRLPEILSMVCFVIFDVDPYIYKIICLMYSRCLTLYDLSNVAYILSLSTPLFFYLGFNTNFYDSLKTLCRFRNS